MPYRAKKRLRWGDGWIELGQKVPEDEQGRNYQQLIRLGMIERVEDGASVPPPPPKKTPEEASDGGGVVCPECGVRVANNFALAGHMRSHKKDK